VLIYYNLFHEIKSVKCTMKFKKIFHKFSLEKNFYSGEEFMAIDN